MDLALRAYQIDLSNKAALILNELKIVCLFMQVRTGKTLTALQTCKNVNAKSVLFITKIKAFSSIKNDYDSLNYDFKLTIINRESLHKIQENYFDVIIIDEVHGYTSYPKPSVYAKEVKQRFGHLPMIFLSGTPTPENYSQYYHLFWLSNNSPFSSWTNFYKWANEFVNIKLRHLGYAQVKDYTDARLKDFKHLIDPYILTFTQEEAGFETSVTENVLEVEMKPITAEIIKRLHKDRFVQNKAGDLILADTGVKLQAKHLQLASGTVKFEDGTSRTIDNSKALFIKDYFKDKKIGIFYKFKEELNMLQDVFCNELTTDLQEFDNSNKNIALQFVSGREGISLRNADYLVAINIDFSATTYWQFKDRMSVLGRKNNNLFWIFSKDIGNIKSIERMVYDSVMNKKNYTLSVFKKNYSIDK